MNNVKLLVFSDTHGFAQPMLDVVGDTKNVAVVFHLGDGMNDAELVKTAFPSVHVYAVRGNCDPPGPYPLEGCADFGGAAFFYTHGHTYGVKQDLTKLWIAAKTVGARAALFGHTHTPYYEFRAGIHLFNPGSISLTRIASSTYGQITFEQGEPKLEIMRFGE